MKTGDEIYEQIKKFSEYIFSNSEYKIMGMRPALVLSQEDFTALQFYFQKAGLSMMGQTNNSEVISDYLGNADAEILGISIFVFKRIENEDR